jgi:high affinity Mn2+ porin
VRHKYFQLACALRALLCATAAVYAAPAIAAQEAKAPSAQDAPTPVPRDVSAEATDPDPVPMMFPHLESDRWWLSGQSNFIFQTHPPFHAAYSGKNSLNPNYEKATSRVLTLYTGVRINDTTEFLVDIEEAGGAALSTGLGLAGNPDLDIVRNPSLSKAPYLARGMIHKVFALSKDKVENGRSYLSLFKEPPRRRLEIRFGKFSMVDFFDQNAVGSSSLTGRSITMGLMTTRRTRAATRSA